MNKYIYIWQFQVSDQSAVSYMVHHHQGIKVLLDLSVHSSHTKCSSFFTVLLFAEEIIEEVSTGHFSIELVEFRAHVHEWDSLIVLYNYSYCFTKTANLILCKCTNTGLHTYIFEYWFVLADALITSLWVNLVEGTAQEKKSFLMSRRRKRKSRPLSHLTA